MQHMKIQDNVKKSVHMNCKVSLCGVRCRVVQELGTNNLNVKALLMQNVQYVST
jgi:hypothetical protein